MEEYDCKITILGNGHVIAKRFEKAIKENNNRNKSGAGSSIRECKPRKLYSREIEQFCNLVDLNFSKGDLYVTLTYEKQDVSLNEAGRDFENWIKRMRDRYGDFRYIAVRSFQQRGTIHFHLLLNIERIPKQQLQDGTFGSIWGHGSVNVRKIYTLPLGFYKGKLKSYLIKNLKEFKRDKLSFGKRLYLKSNNLINPTVIRCNAIEFKSIIEAAREEVKEFATEHFRNEFLGEVSVTTYKISPEFQLSILEHFKV